jgi:hypothetical protein
MNTNTFSIIVGVLLLIILIIILAVVIANSNNNNSGGECKTETSVIEECKDKIETDDSQVLSAEFSDKKKKPASRKYKK